MAALLRRVLDLRLCPKADLRNISEFSPVKVLFLAVNEENGWSSLVMSSTYLVARGIRGREGVQVLYEFCSARSFQLDWHDDHFVDSFVTFFEEQWEAAVVRSQEVSALSHQEGRHAGLSGMNFVATLKDIRHRQVLFQDVAVRLACFFDDSKDMSASTLMDFYHALVSHPFAPTTDSYEVHHHGCRLLRKKPKVEHDAVKVITPMVRDGTYNSMDFLRCFYNIMQLFEAPSVSFTTSLWSKMTRCQSKNDVDFFKLTMEDANMLIQETPTMNWTTLLVLLCETRQAIDAKGMSHFHWTLDKLDARKYQLASAVEDATSTIVNMGAKGSTCYCVRLYMLVDAWLEPVGKNVAVDEDER